MTEKLLLINLKPSMDNLEMCRYSPSRINLMILTFYEKIRACYTYRYYLRITTHRNYQLSELLHIIVSNSNDGNSEVFDRNFHFLIVSNQNYHCFLATHRHLLVASFSCYGPSDDSRTILRHALYCDKP